MRTKSNFLFIRQRYHIAIWILITISYFAICLQAQSRKEAGRPFITNYSPKDYNAHPQNWAVVQDERGIMYFGNSNGVLEYDGISWRMIPSQNNAYVQALAIDGNGRIYCGGGGNIGYLSPDSVGRLQFVSLLDYLTPEDRLLVNLWHIFVAGENIYFQGYNQILRWNGTAMHIWRSDLRFLSSFMVNKTLYVHQAEIGLLKLTGDSLQLVPDGDRFANQRIDALLPYQDQEMLIVTRDQGMYLYDRNSFKAFKTEADQFLLRNQTHTAAVLPDGTFAIATVRGGVVVMDRAGRVLQYLDQTAGLLNNFVRSIYSDRHGAMWLALDNGIARVETPSPLTLYDKQTGLTSYVVSILRHDGILYVATGQGVFYLDSSIRKFKHVFGLVARSWSLVSMGKVMLVATDDGVYGIKGDAAFVIKKSIGESFRAYCLHRSKQDTTRVFVGLIDGLASLRRANGKWIDEGRIEGINETVRNFLEKEDGSIWLGTQARGTLHLDSPNGSSVQNPHIERFGLGNGLPSGGVSVFSVSGKEFFATNEGLFHFDQKNNSFISDSTFAFLSFGGSQEEYSLKEDHRGNIWLNFGSETAYAIRQADGSYLPRKTAFMQISELPNYFIYPEDDGITWFGSEEVLIRYDPHIDKDYTRDYPALIRRVIIGEDSVVYGGAIRANEVSETGPNDEITFDYKNNSLRFEFSATSYDNPFENRFQTILEGFDDHWLAWSKESKRNYTNLPNGEYTFKVRANNIYEHESQEASYSFKILPPWWRTGWAYLLYGLAFIALIFTADRVQRRRLIAKERHRSQLREAELRAESENERRKNIELLSEIGKSITATLSTKSIIDTAYENVNALMDATVFGIGIYNEQNHSIDFPASKEKGDTLSSFSHMLKDENRPSVWCFKNQKELFSNDYVNEYHKYIKLRKAPVAGKSSASLIYLPLTNKDRKLGVITAQSYKKDAYTEYHLNILRNLATYTSIALDNADAYRKLNSTLDDLKATQQQLITQEKLASLGALTAGIAHEIKNPLNFVNNFADLSVELVEELREDLEKQKGKLRASEFEDLEEILSSLEQNAKKINEHGKRADSIVHSMLQHSRGKAGERQETDINAMLEEDLNLAYHGMRARDSSFNVTMETDFDKSVGELNIVPQDISRVFLNILTNSFYEVHRKKGENGDRYTPLVTICSKSKGEQVEIRIRDNGDGIPESIRDKLFNPFFTTKPTGQGTGLGLSLSYDIIAKEHHGDITFESKEGEYTEFIIALPKNEK